MTDPTSSVVGRYFETVSANRKMLRNTDTAAGVSRDADKAAAEAADYIFEGICVEILDQTCIRRVDIRPGGWALKRLHRAYRAARIYMPAWNA